MISPKKSRQFSFQLIPPSPGPDHSCIGIKCSYHLFYVFLRARLLGWQTSLFSPLDTGLLPTVLCKYSNYSVQHPAKIEKKTKNCIVGEFNGKGRGECDSQNKWNNYTVRYWIELNMHTYYYLLLLLLLYTIFYLFWERRTLEEEKNAPAKSTVLDGHPDRNVQKI